MTNTDILYVGANHAIAEHIGRLADVSSGQFCGITIDDVDRAFDRLDQAAPVAVIVDCMECGPTQLDLINRLTLHHPFIVRIAITQPDDKSTMLHLVDQVHQVIGPDIQPARLIGQIRNALAMREIVSSEQLQAQIASIDSLPSLPESYTNIVSALRDPDVSLNKVSGLISADPAITAKLLQVVNSAYFGLSRQVTNVSHAVNLVGVNTIQSLVLATSVFEDFKSIDLPKTSVEEIFSRSVAVGSKARLLAHAFDFDPYAAENTLISGMLHDIGRLIMARYFASEFAVALKMSEDTGTPFYEAADEVLGASDAVMGAYLLSLWGMSDPIIEAVAMRYCPRLTPTPTLGPLTAVHLAWAIDLDERRNVNSDDASAIDMEYLASLGLDGQISALRGFCSGALA